MYKKPMLACGGVSLEEVKYPKLASPKVDGIRCLIINGELLTRSMKPQPTRALKTFLKEAIEYSIKNQVAIDGELYDHTKPFNWHQSTFRSFDGQPLPTTKLWVIDVVSNMLWGNTTNGWRFGELIHQDIIAGVGKLENCRAIPQAWAHNAGQAASLYDQYIHDGCEGMMLRDPERGYKHGRSSPSEQWLLKFKALVDYDAKIIDVVEGQKLKEGAEVRMTPTGDKDRSHKQADFEPSGMAGYIVVELEDGRTVRIGTWKGWTHELRLSMLHNKEQYVGRWIRFRSQAVGEVDAPRIPFDVKWKDGSPIECFELRDDKE
jgi:DNA ligase 1